MDYFIVLVSIVFLVFLVATGVLGVRDFIVVFLIILSYVLGKNSGR